MTKKKTNNDRKVIYILVGVIVILIILLGAFYLKEELFDHHEENYYPNVDNNIDDMEDNQVPSKTPNDAGDEQYIGQQKALNVVLKSLKLTSKDIYDLDIELDYKFGKTVYDLDFKYQHYEYEYYVEATTGKIVKSFRELD